MKYDYISRIVQKLKKKYRTDDVWELCDAMKVIINPVPMGSGSTAVKGFFIRSARMKVIKAEVPPSKAFSYAAQG